MQGIRDVASVLTDLADRSRAEAVATKVNKGAKGTFTYIPWNETAKLLSDVFGPFGWSAKIIGSSYHQGIYTIDLDLEVRATQADGSVVAKSVPGRGVGTVKAEYIDNNDLHDTAAKAARSDALSTAAKMLGDAFGLYLYDKGDPARTSTGAGAASTSSAAADRRPSEKQQAVLRKNGYTDEQVSTMTFPQWKGVVDAIFGGTTPAIAPMKAPVAAGRRNDEDEFPY